MKVTSVTQDLRRYYLTAYKPWDGGMIAVISLGHPQMGDKKVTVCDVAKCKNIKAARKWYRQQMAKMPWQTVRQEIAIPEGLGAVTGLRVDHGSLVADTASGIPMIVPLKLEDRR